MKIKMRMNDLNNNIIIYYYIIKTKNKMVKILIKELAPN